MEDENELFSFLTFFKICKVYQTLRASKNSNKRRIIKNPLLQTSKKIKSAPMESHSIKHFSMFSQSTKDTETFTSENNCISSESNNKKKKSTLDTEIFKCENISLSSESNHKSLLQVDEDKNSIDLDVTLKHSTTDKNKNISESTENSKDPIIDEICNQSDDGVLTYADDNESNVELKSICLSDLQISLEANNGQPAIAQKKKRRPRRHRRPGDPPLPKLPPLNKPKKEKTRKYRIHPEHRDRSERNYFFTTFREIIENQEERFIHLVRMTPKSFDVLYRKVLPPLLLNRQSIMPKERLTITLIYLAHGIHFDHLSEKFRLGFSTIRHIVLRTCECLWEILSPIYMREPTSEDYLEIAEEFKTEWNLPNCVGVLGTRRVPFRASRLVNCAGKTYKWNEVKDVIVMASCDSKYLFRQTGITVELPQSEFYKNIISSTLPLPPNRPLYDESFDIDFQYYFIGSAEFPQMTNLMRPFSHCNTLDAKQKVYNHSIECAQDLNATAFNILSTTWRVLLTNGAYTLENWSIIVRACLSLHNFLLVNDKQIWYDSDGHIKSSSNENMQLGPPAEWIDNKFPVEFVSDLRPVEAIKNGECNVRGLEAREVLTDYLCIEKTSI